MLSCMAQRERLTCAITNALFRSPMRCRGLNAPSFARFTRWRERPMNVSDFLDHAEEMANDGRPACCRSAVSRAYYAAHHAAVAFLFQVGVRTPRGPRCHVAAFNALVTIDVATDQPVKQAGVAL